MTVDTEVYYKCVYCHFYCIRCIPGQVWVLQFLSSVLEPGQLPPKASFINFDRDRDWVPLPQVFEHEENLPHSDHLQFTENI